MKTNRKDEGAGGIVEELFSKRVLRCRVPLAWISTWGERGERTTHSKGREGTWTRYGVEGPEHLPKERQTLR